jgi:hypothetical protein
MQKLEIIGKNCIRPYNKLLNFIFTTGMGDRDEERRAKAKSKHTNFEYKIVQSLWKQGPFESYLN